MQSPEAEEVIQEKLRCIGTKLLESPPPLKEDLLSLLDILERCLSEVDQLPSKTMQGAMCPAKKALIGKELFEHADVDVNVSVALCINEIMRITAPDAPYDDEKMKEIFRVTVAAFELLWDFSNHSYIKRVLMLETVAKVRSCILMLDLDCDAFLVDMFGHFLKAIRENHPKKVFPSMESIMTMVISESEDISPQLLSPLLYSLKKGNQDVLPIRQKLAEKVIANCATKLMPYMKQAVQFMGFSVEDYEEIVAFLCQETRLNAITDAAVDNSKENVVAKEITQEASSLCGNNAATVQPLMMLMGNGAVQSDGNKGSDEAQPPRKRPLHENHTNNISGNKTVVDNDSTDISKLDKQEQCSVRGQQSRASIEGFDQHQVANGEAASKLSRGEEGSSKQNDCSPSLYPSCNAPAIPSESDKENKESPSAAEAQNNKDISAIQSLDHMVVLHDGRGCKRRGSTVKRCSKQENDLGSLSVPNKSSSPSQDANEVLQGMPISSVKESGGKTSQDSETKGKSDEVINQNVKPVSTPGNASSQNKGSNRRKSGRNLGKELGVNGDLKKTMKDESLAKDQEGKKRQQSCQTKAVNGKFSVKASDMPEDRESFGENLVGACIKVWWPLDKKFYKGAIASFDPMAKKHKVLYADGEEEILDLKNEKWEFVRTYIAGNGGQHSSPESAFRLGGETTAEISDTIAITQGSEPKASAVKTGRPPKTSLKTKDSTLQAAVTLSEAAGTKNSKSGARSDKMEESSTLKGKSLDSTKAQGTETANSIARIASKQAA
ncbi:hypothetical protein RJ641_027652 [Dillenia turbinata]|uniref:Tudor domain-containing protein n=1 Tax=Dillenia turbinata TaxID=194707 RepID=A0AAN8VXN5_9MAGN